jgi:hypothetical protein
MESQCHLIDLVDKKYLSEERRLKLNALAETALEEVTGLMEYLQSPEALRNARRVRERRIASRPEKGEHRRVNSRSLVLRPQLASGALKSATDSCR